jgi:hypothetical protein
MEAYCKVVRALEDKFYGTELNHVPRRYNEEADELAKIASGRITVPPNVFARDVAQPSVTLEPHHSNCTEPSGLPRIQRTQTPWTRTPRTRRSCSPSSRGTAPTRPKPWTSSQPPARWIGATNILLGSTEGNFPRTGPRPSASPGWPNPSPSSTASCTSVPPSHPAAMRAHPPGARAPPGHTRGRVRTPCRTSHPRGQRVPPGLLLAHRGR